MKAESDIRDVQSKNEQAEAIDASQNIKSRDILETKDITLEEVAIDGICGVY